MASLPRGTVTFLFTDIEGSTRLLQELGAEQYAAALDDHRRALREAFARHGGVEVDTQGDAFLVAFRRASDALAAAREGQLALVPTRVRVRMGIHTGEPLVTPEGYVGMDVHKGARIAAAGHGGQVLVSEQTASLVGADGLRDLGVLRLKDLTRPEHVFQLCAPGLSAEFLPLRTLDARPHNLPVQPTVLIGREREIREITERLRRREERLLTLTGPGGTGKTRLALQAAADLVDSFADGTYFVNLAPISDPALVPSAIARVLGVREAPERLLTETLPEYLREKQLLLLLDNFEQVMEAAPLVAELLAAAPGVE
ncbi:MAG TPA: adenylate/guanylate cyclase domain-containing protein, partial [Longimicrobiaceae bacterium]|nr:adenylate/guanylate cyclase domain-containing protein [Longimicrobiaceae bacterium]